jgi:hypothetical protein
MHAYRIAVVRIIRLKTCPYPILTALKINIMVLKNSLLPYARPAFILTLMILLSGCLTSRRLDKYVARQYGNRIPAVTRKNHDAIKITSSMATSSKDISTTQSTISNVLPLLFYWQCEFTKSCSLNPAIPINKFTNTLYGQATRKLSRKLNGRQLELSIKALPHGFAIDDKAHMIWFIYGFGWDKVSIQPETSDLVVSYKLLKDGEVIKNGEISVQNEEKNTRLGMFQSWKNATSAYIAAYNHDIDNMTRSFIDQLGMEL